jgi:hypothetical protein
MPPRVRGPWCLSRPAGEASIGENGKVVDMVTCAVPGLNKDCAKTAAAPWHERLAAQRDRDDRCAGRAGAVAQLAAPDFAGTGRAWPR